MPLCVPASVAAVGQSGCCVWSLRVSSCPGTLLWTELLTCPCSFHCRRGCIGFVLGISCAPRRLTSWGVCPLASGRAGPSGCWEGRGVGSYPPGRPLVCPHRPALVGGTPRALAPLLGLGRPPRPPAPPASPAMIPADCAHLSATWFLPEPLQSLKVVFESSKLTQKNVAWYFI